MSSSKHHTLLGQEGVEHPASETRGANRDFRLIIIFHPSEFAEID
jgi:hypothetical protein